MHYVLDLWANRWRQREAQGDMVIVRYADDFVVGFESEADARRFWDALRVRLQEFALSLHPDKTRLIEFGRHAADRRAKVGLAGDLPLLRFCLHLRQNASGQVPRTPKEPARSHAGKTKGGQEGAAQAHASADT